MFVHSFILFREASFSPFDLSIEILLFFIQGYLVLAIDHGENSFVSVFLQLSLLLLKSLKIDCLLLREFLVGKLFHFRNVQIKDRNGLFSKLERGHS